MKKFEVGSRVTFDYRGEIKTGVVKSKRNDLKIALVKVPTEEDLLYKVLYSAISVLPESEESDVPASITITQDEFKEITDKVIVKSLEDNAVVKMLQVFCQLLQRELFGKDQAV